ncbi:phosphatidylglycerol:prolipoprotein diacylglycerol transferase [Natranaerovirga pectinivora]|uniref:Phosphatidylglycerol--prolipoprotein diacylglyceryl transferase n=1 Tax=Natranaerovirga pectinivora TaxID=682400 RepID=A0A4R3MMS6_9FIRM|nr:prolipoprotein diacylglyceryl transferase [Natranaerovirga pectinivora]TCT15565.1 phosphatidylglycerol:prolipoprotein diacylglycerol transferase [Natranaerovirga pectinivora]
MKTLFTIGNLHIPFFGIMIAIGITVGYFLIRYEAKRKGIDAEKISDLFFGGIVGGLIGGRLGYILFYNFNFYITNPIEILKVYNGGLAIHGSIIGGTIAVLIFIKKNNLKVFEVADIVTPALILGQAIGRVGCDVYGKVMTVPRFWGIPINGEIYHPAQVYEFVLNYLLFMVLWIKRDKIKYQGQLFGYYLIGFGFIRSFVELFRENPTVFGFLSVSHVLSIFIILAGIIWIKIMKYKSVSTQHIHSGSNTLFVALKVVFLMLISIALYYVVQLNF